MDNLKTISRCKDSDLSCLEIPVYLTESGKSYCLKHKSQANEKLIDIKEEFDNFCNLFGQWSIENCGHRKC